MIADWVAGLGAVLLQGWLLLAVVLLVLGGVLLAGIGIGRWRAFREVDAGRAEVNRACRRASGRRFRGVVPAQRESEQ